MPARTRIPKSKQTGKPVMTRPVFLRHMIASLHDKATVLQMTDVARWPTLNTLLNEVILKGLRIVEEESKQRKAARGEYE